MAIPITNVPVLTGKIAEHFEEICRYNAEHMQGSQFTGTFSEKYGAMLLRSKQVMTEMQKHSSL